MFQNILESKCPFIGSVAIRPSVNGSGANSAGANRLTAAIQALETRAQTWDAQQMAGAGAIVILDSQVERGLVRRDGNAASDEGGVPVGHTVGALTK